MHYYTRNRYYIYVNDVPHQRNSFKMYYICKKIIINTALLARDRLLFSTWFFDFTFCRYEYVWNYLTMPNFFSALVKYPLFKLKTLKKYFIKRKYANVGSHDVITVAMLLWAFARVILRFKFCSFFRHDSECKKYY